MSIQEMEARRRFLSARIEGQMWPQLWLADLMELAGLNDKLRDAYAAQRLTGGRSHA